MSSPLRLQPAARKDLRAAFQWYESQECGLGGRLLDSIKAAFQRIEGNPEMFPVRFDSIRRAPAHTFPYLIFFSIQDNRVVVHAIYHTSRNPEVLKSHLRRNFT